MILSMIPTLKLVGLGALLSMSFMIGYEFCDTSHDAQMQEYRDQAMTQKLRADIALAQLQEKESQREAHQMQLRRDLEKYLSDPGNQRDCVDADGLRIINDALRGG